MEESMGKRYSAEEAADFLSGYRSSECVGGFVEVSPPSVLNRRHLVEFQFSNGTTIKLNG